MKKLKLCGVSTIIASVICVSAQAENGSNNWGDWDSKQKHDDVFFVVQTIPEAELLESEGSFSPIDGGFSLFGTQLEGTPYQGLDTAPIELDENGVPVELSGAGA